MTETAGTDPDAFHRFEHAGWEVAAEHYAGAFGDLTQQTIGPMLDAIEIGPGTRLLDVATGPGFVAAAAAERSARPVGVDFSATMVACARRRQPSLSFKEGDAEALPFEDGSFEAETMNFGLLHLSRPDAAIAEAHRVLVEGGRFAFTVWADPSEAVGFGLVLEAVEECGRLDIGLPDGPPFFRFSSAETSRTALQSAGFSDVAVTLLPLVWQVASADAVVDRFLRGAVRTAALLRAQSADALVAIRAHLRRAMELYARGNGFALPTPAVLTTATKNRESK